ncbi:MAG: exonuclease subunit SbcD, partial [Clostridia bacterium]|nr:exonuclease subunit SbcD [Clostridia bacterium]
MRILHTSDWHIGKRLLGRERLFEQEQVLNEMLAICNAQEVELVVIAGDVFDTFVPSAEAEQLFFKKIKSFAESGRAVLIISGNHDDGVRLSASAPISDEYGVYFIGNDRRALPLVKRGKAYPVRSGKGYAVFENEKGERVFFSALPYPNEARFKEEKSELPFAEQMRVWVEESANENTERFPSVLVAHIFAAGGVTSESEREISVGGARAVSIDDLPPFDYVALGHLHKRQKAGKGHAYYSGSPLQYSFDEAGTEKSVQVFDLSKNGVENLQIIPLLAGRKLVRLQAVGLESAHELLAQNAGALVELTLHLTEPLTRAESRALAEHENLVSLVADVQTQSAIYAESKKGYSDEQLFEEFYSR